MKLWAKPSSKGKTLAEILSSDKNREYLLGVLNSVPPTKDEVERDIEKVRKYSDSQDYEVWAKEAWAKVIDCVDKLMDDELKEREVDFFRGKLAATMDLLRVSYMARENQKRIIEEKKMAGLDPA